MGILVSLFSFENHYQEEDMNINTRTNTNTCQTWKRHQHQKT